MSAQVESNHVKIGGKDYRILAFFSQKQKADAYAKKQRSIGYYKSVRVITRSSNNAVLKYWVCGRK